MSYTGKPPRHTGKIKNPNNPAPQSPYNTGLHFLPSQNVSNSGQLQINRKYINNMGNINEVSVVQYRRTTNMQLKNNSLEMNHLQNLRHHHHHQQQPFVFKTPQYHNHVNPNMLHKFPVNHSMQRKIVKDHARPFAPLPLAHRNVEFIGKRSRELSNEHNANMLSNKYMQPRLKNLPTNNGILNHKVPNLQKEQVVNGGGGNSTNNIQQKEVPEKLEKTIKHVDDDKENKKAETQQKVEPICNGNKDQPREDQSQEDTKTKSTKLGREKTPMCLINDLSRFNKISFQYRLTSEDGPAHYKRFTVTLMLGDEEYTAEGLKIKEAQHLAAKEAIEKTKYKHPTPKVNRRPDDDAVKPNITPTVELNALAMKLGQQTYYIMDHQQVENNSNYRSINQQFDTAQVLTHQQKPTGLVENILHNGKKIQTVNQKRQNLSRYQNRFSAFQHISQNGSVPTPPYTLYSPSKITLIVGTKQFVGVGKTLQLAKHDAASNALKVLKEQMEKEQLETQNESTEENDHKSPISLVFEIGMKRNLPVDFKVLREDGPAHMRTFVTACVVGDIVTEGEGTGKKISKKKAAYKMLEELKKLPSLSPVASSPVKRAKPKASSKKNCGQSKDVDTTDEHKKDAEKLPCHKSKKVTEETEQTNSIGKLIEWHQNRKEKEPEFKLINELGKENIRRKQFVIEVSSNNVVVRGVGINKRLAKQDAAQKFLNAVMDTNREQPGVTPLNENTARSSSHISKKNKPENFSKKTNAKPIPEQDAVKNVVMKERKNLPLASTAKESEPPKETVSEVKNSENLSEQNSNNLLQNKESSQAHEKNDTPTTLTSSNSLALAAATKESTTTITTSNSIKSLNLHMKDQLMYLAKLLGFEVEFSDYPKGNHNEFLTIVMLSTTPPQICHGVGVNAIESQEDAAKNALKILSEMGLNNAIKS